MQEKFLTIRWLLTGVPSRGRHASAELVEWLKYAFACLQRPFEDIVRRSGIRYSFVSYNFLFRRLFDLYGTPHYGLDFVSTSIVFLRLLTPREAPIKVPQETRGHHHSLAQTSTISQVAVHQQ